MSTVDSSRKSWVESANRKDCDFPIQNLTCGIFSTADRGPLVGVAIGDAILDLSVPEAEGLLASTNESRVFDRSDLNAFMALGATAWKKTHADISALLDARNKRLRGDSGLRTKAIVPMASAQLHLSIFVRSFTDVYASKEHATNVGAMFRDPANALMPNWLHISIGYNGRASTVVVSGTDVRRPLGQTKTPDATGPAFDPTQRLDFELELGAINGTPSRTGEPVTVEQADEMIFGFVLLNDWSARDIQAWEYQPVGPFPSKAFATTIGPWVVTREALEPFRVPTPEGVKPLLPYLRESASNNFDIHLEFGLQSDRAAAATIVSRSNARYLYYSAAQQIAHHAISGCAICTGDLIGSGTISGPDRQSLGSLLELTWGGKKRVPLANGVARAFIEDGDTISMTGWCLGDGYHVGFGTCEGTIVPSPGFAGT